MEQLRVSDNLVEIGHILRMLVGEKHVVMLWQHDEKKQKRNVCYAELSKIDFDKMKLSVKPFDNIVKKFQDKLTLYIHSNFKSILFKIESAQITPRKIIFSLPKEIRLI